MVGSCAFSPDGMRALSAGRDGTLRLWDAQSGEELGTWSGHEGVVLACAFSPDGTRALSAGQDGTLRLWDARSGDDLGTWSGHVGVVRTCAFSPDGTRVLSAGEDGTLRLWEIPSGRLLRVHQIEGPDHAVWDLIDGPVNARIVEASEGAWRWLRWQERDASGVPVDVLPAETFGPLPPPRRLGR